MYATNFQSADLCLCHCLCFCICICLCLCFCLCFCLYSLSNPHLSPELAGAGSSHLLQTFNLQMLPLLPAAPGHFGKGARGQGGQGEGRSWSVRARSEISRCQLLAMQLLTIAQKYQQVPMKPRVKQSGQNQMISSLPICPINGWSCFVRNCKYTKKW